MKRISNVRTLALGALVACLLLATAEAQNNQINNKRKAAKLVQPPPTETTASEKAEPPAAQAEANRPKPLPAVLNNPRLQALVLDRFLPQIDLTPEQKGKIRDVRVQHIRRMQTLMAMERAHTMAYDEALFDPGMDQKEIEKRTTQLAEVRHDSLKAQARFFLDMRQILTPEQFTKLRQLMEEERERRNKNVP
jgi:Spy/CpxP family protein refolding chaperone